MKEFEFDPKTQRYRITKGAGKGQFIPYDAIATLTEQYIDQSKIEIDDLTNRLLNRSISVGDWEREVAQELKDAHINSFSLGHGGIGRLGEAERSKISGRLLEEYRYLRSFSEDISSGKLSEAKILDRSSMYVESLHRSFELGRELSHAQSGYAEEKRIRNTSESCQDCIDYESQGWQPIGTLPPPGSECQCRSRCRCHKEYRRAESHTSRILQKNGWLKQRSREMDLNTSTNGGSIKNVGQPTDEQIVAINQHSPLGDLSVDEVTTLAFYASNNLLWHSNGAWTVPALSEMGQLLIGRKFLLNHNWDESEKAQGKVYDYQLLYSQDAPDEAIYVAGMGEINKYITKRNGYARLILHAYFENGSQVLEDFRYGRLDDVSTGVLSSGLDSYICPICSERFGRDISFAEKDSEGLRICPHDIPTPLMLYFFGDDSEMNFAPFYYRSLKKADGAHGIELSAVVSPDLPVAGIVSPYRMAFL